MNATGFRLHPLPPGFGQCSRCGEGSAFFVFWSYTSRAGHSVRHCVEVCRIHANRFARIHGLRLPEPTVKP